MADQGNTRADEVFEPLFGQIQALERELHELYKGGKLGEISSFQVQIYPANRQTSIVAHRTVMVPVEP